MLEVDGAATAGVDNAVVDGISQTEVVKSILPMEGSV